ncbi:hypothetical protein EZV62_011958 [Acer yangbiense]|uniref:Amino acid transporter transmembrane domain-containing protein n=1 Tax=Acer yangbiense TaxID=1000413 RepID=A0A5C7I737_9ROSI|nr:hypothetical protein EZV62_011958 [Acer yangbiense]
MGEVAQEVNFFEESPIHDHDHERPTMIKTPEQQLITINIESSCSVTGTCRSNRGGGGGGLIINGWSSSKDDHVLAGGIFDDQFQDDWLPITESRNGNIISVVFHLLCSGIGFQALSLPVAFVTLGWIWGIICLSLAFSWQLYTIWILVHLSEPVTGTGTRHSRYLRLAIAAFGPKLGKLLCIFPVMYLSGGSCVMLIITAGANLERLFTIIVCGGGDDTTCIEAKSLPGVVWFLTFTCVAILIAQLPNLNSIAKVSMIGSITAVGSCTLIWALSIKNGRPDHVSYHSLKMPRSDHMDKFGDIFNAIGIIVLAFRGHNLVLEIQGTLPSNGKNPPRKTMWRGVTISYLIIAMTLFPLAICGFWAYGNKVTTDGGLLNAFWQVHGHNTSRLVLGTMYLLAVINNLSSFPIYAMPTFDNLEFLYISAKKRRCPKRVRVGLRLFVGGLTFFIAVAFPFLSSLGPLIGGITLPLTYVYPCFMYISIRKLGRNGGMWWLNLGLGCLGTILSVVLVVAAVWNLANKGLHANFFRP